MQNLFLLLTTLLQEPATNNPPKAPPAITEAEQGNYKDILINVQQAQLELAAAKEAVRTAQDDFALKLADLQATVRRKAEALEKIQAQAQAQFGAIVEAKKKDGCAVVGTPTGNRLACAPSEPKK